ncbi:hypothetical protein CYLTODRAFT_419416 [Cylindrobasidium torrendii FP15055 ss-10]|uniref:Uncharacterized protein n=1 Tax=Cylindrobasidium torrendii FP15055 ss-10 TaxID=1314674 RepID=A0A0D7BK16_9AGAR|nr:hypothetical protein CYLTODRAFT_419416 [Cylindrobasidium torrendii FP15055 ss-10]
MQGTPSLGMDTDHGAARCKPLSIKRLPHAKNSVCTHCLHGTQNDRQTGNKRHDDAEMSNKSDEVAWSQWRPNSTYWRPQLGCELRSSESGGSMVTLERYPCLPGANNLWTFERSTNAMTKLLDSPSRESMDAWGDDKGGSGSASFDAAKDGSRSPSRVHLSTERP